MKHLVLRASLLLLCLSASMAQAWTAQFHAHASQVTAGIASVAGTDDTGAGEEGGCLLCQIASQGGAAALLSVVPDPPVRQDLRHDFPVPRPAASSCSTPSHHWLSRGPPRG